ncbi:MAG: ABC transporter ATP-binding protein [Bacteroidales bacterium]|nr:ABC transporter ATP-binding protein [Bacteroidales bacterium]MDP3003116.1 ABC transporter ATP-binding protein [Bacteroidales bacterium]
MLEINNISKRYKKGSEEFTALENVSLKIEKSDYMAVTGASGAGKSTLLHAIGGLVHPDSGEVLYKGRDIYKQKSKVTDEYRKKHVGFMFQQFHLMPYLTVLDNIRLACYEKHQLHSINNYLDKCSLTGLKNKYPSELSVGEKQRTAFIRAIISNPDILLADEPTGNLDPANSSILMSLVEDFHKNGGTVVLVSHDPLAAKYANRIITLEKGRIVL